MNIQIKLINFSLLVTGVVVHATSTFAFQQSGVYYDKLENHSYIRPQLIARTMNFTMSPADSKAKVRYSPSAKSFLGVGIHLFDIDVGLNFPLNRKPGSKNLDLQGHMTTQSWGIDAMWQRYNTFQSPKTFGKKRLAHTMMHGYYLFNHRQYSLRAVTNQNERQLRSAGSPILHSLMSHLEVGNEEGMIPQDLESEFGNYYDITRYKHWMFGLMPGYAYTHVEGPFIISGSAAFGAAHYWETYESPTSPNKDLNIKPLYQINTYLGLDNTEYFAGISMELRSFNSGSEGLNNSLFFYSVRLAVGYRFVEKGIFSKGFFDLFEKK